MTQSRDLDSLSDEQLITIFRDPNEADDVRDKAYAIANERRVKTMSKRHSEDDEVETL